MQLPITINKYQLVEKLGEGAFAFVYKGIQIETADVVAVKKMKKMTKQDVEMVKKQIGIMKELNHKNIVQYKQDFREKGQWYIILEFCGKGDMEQFKKKVGKIPQQHCKLFIRGILQALVELHKKKIAHRDLKLANILINDDYKLKLADFGFSKDYESGYLKSFCGTPLSMAPEILKHQQYNERCDVWSLGVLTYMMLYNKPPYFPTKSDGVGIVGITNAVTLRNHKFEQNVQVSQSGKKFINECLQKKMNERPTTLELLKHEWFEGQSQTNISRLRTEMIKTSFTGEKDELEQQANKLCEIMLFGVFEEHLKKISQTMQLNIDLINRNKSIFEKYYGKDSKIFQCYLRILLKHLQKLGERDIIYILFDKSYKINIQAIKKYKQFQKEIACFIAKESEQTVLPKKEKINLEKQVIKFCVTEIELLIDCNKDEQIAEKLILFKDWCKFITTEYESTMIEIKWGQRSDLERYSKYVNQFLKNIKEENLIKIINEEAVSDDDLESIWLIYNQIKKNTAKRKSEESELGKLALFILNIASNFQVDKTFHTQKMLLSEGEFWTEDLMGV